MVLEMSKYDPLQIFLADLPPSQQEVTLTFKLIEEIIESGLPKSAYLYKSWWSNEKLGNHSQAECWLNARWKVETVDLEKHWVRYTRKVPVRIGR